MNQLQTQGSLIVKDLDRQIREARVIGDLPVKIILGPKARKAIIAFHGFQGFTFDRDRNQELQEFYLGIPVCMTTKGFMGRWTAHISSLLPDGRVARAMVEG